jgi:hypothetical protein
MKRMICGYKGKKYSSTVAKGSCSAHDDELSFGKLAVSPPVRGCAGAWYATTKN